MTNLAPSTAMAVQGVTKRRFSAIQLKYLSLRKKMELTTLTNRQLREARSQFSKMKNSKSVDRSFNISLKALGVRLTSQRMQATKVSTASIIYTIRCQLTSSPTIKARVVWVCRAVQAIMRDSNFSNKHQCLLVNQFTSRTRMLSAKTHEAANNTSRQWKSRSLW